MLYMAKSAFLGAKFHSHKSQLDLFRVAHADWAPQSTYLQLFFFHFLRTIVKSNQLLREFRLKAQKYVEVIHIVIIIIPEICSLFRFESLNIFSMSIEIISSS